LQFHNIQHAKAICKILVSLRYLKHLSIYTATC